MLCSERPSTVYVRVYLCVWMTLTLYSHYPNTHCQTSYILTFTLFDESKDLFKNIVRNAFNASMPTTHFIRMFVFVLWYYIDGSVHSTQHSCRAIRNSCNSFSVSVVISISFAISIRFLLYHYFFFSNISRIQYTHQCLDYDPEHHIISDILRRNRIFQNWEKKLLSLFFCRVKFVLVLYNFLFLIFVPWHLQRIKCF